MLHAKLTIHLGFGLLVLVGHVGVLVFTRPQRGRILLHELVNVLILTVNDHAGGWIVLSELHFEEVYHTS